MHNIMNACIKGYKTFKNDISCFGPVELCTCHFPSVLFNVSQTYALICTWICLYSIYSSTNKDLASHILTKTWNCLIFKKILTIVKSIYLGLNILVPATNFCPKALKQLYHIRLEVLFLFRSLYYHHLCVTL